MSRPLRIIYEGACYYVINRGRRGEKIFHGIEDYQAFIELIKQSCSMWKIRVTAYCLMSNHYHLLLQTPKANLPRCMRHLNGIYTQRHNRLHGSDGQLFRGRYKAILVDADNYLLELVRYIHRNPVRAGMAQRVDDYAWCSHQGYVSKKREWNWLNKDFAIDMLEPNKSLQRRAYNTFVNQEDSKEILQFFQKKNIPAIVGKDSFVDKIKKKYFKGKQHREVPEAKVLAPDIETIKRAVCRNYKKHPRDLLRSRRGTTNEARNVAIYLIRQCTGEKLENIGKEFNVSNYSTVSSVVVKVSREHQANIRLKNRINNIIKSFSKGQ
jgi:REP element-mobilizing transposase RayT